MSASGSAFDRVLDDVGGAVVGGEFPAGHVDTVEGLIARTGASRSIVREATRVLTSLGMLTASRRVGLRVLPAAEWDVLDPLVIRWRLDGPDRAVQLDELRELRRAVEPEAARAAALAVASGQGDAGPLVAAADRLAGAAGQADPAPFLQADRDLHAGVLALSGNAMFARLQAVVDEALRERVGVTPDVHDVGLHADVADAIARGDADGATEAMREIVDRTTTLHE